MGHHIYILSGLGADERVFQKIDFSGFEVTFVRWISPHRKETIEDYTSRLLEQIKHPNPTLIGISFGGMVAVELSKLISVRKIILLASAKNKKEVPQYFRWAGKLGLHNLLPAKVLKRQNAITYWFFGIRNSTDKKLLKEILADTDPQFLSWAIAKIARWQHNTPPQNCTHIHGSADRILPFKFVKADIKILGGGHFMTVNKSEELSRLLRELLTVE